MVKKKLFQMLPIIPGKLLLINNLPKVKTSIQNNGVIFTLIKIINELKPKVNRSLRYLKGKFPDKFVSSYFEGNVKTPKAIIDYSASLSLTKIISLLGLSVDSDNLIHQLKESFGKKKYYEIVDDLFMVEEFIYHPTQNAKAVSITQTSELPESVLHPKRRRILFITSQFPNPTNGGGNRVLNFIKILSHNNDIYLSTCFIPDDDGSKLKNLEPYCKSIQKIPYWKFGSNQEKILDWLNGQKMDIIHYEWPRSLENYDQRYGKIHIFTYMEAVSLRLKMDIGMAEPRSNKWLGLFSELLHFLRLEIVDTKKFDYRIAVTTKDASFFQSLYPYQNYAVLNHGINFDEFSIQDIEPDPNTLVFVANFGHYPNVDGILYFFKSIWDVIIKEIPKARIYLVGANPPESIIKLANDSQIIVTGSVPDVRQYIQKGSICIAPLINGAGLRGKVIEYAALRRTFVATSIATTGLDFKDGEDYFCADTASEFSNKVIHLLKEPELAAQMADNAFNTTRKNYDTKLLTGYLLSLYQHIMGNQPHAI